MKAVVTGGSKGIGKAIASVLISNGFDVALIARGQEALELTCSELLKLNPGRNIIPIVGDVSSIVESKSIAEGIGNEWKQLDVLVNNVGRFEYGHIMESMDGTLEKMMISNLYSAFYITRHLLKMFKPKKKGHIFFVCSIASEMDWNEAGAYTISKSALLAFSRVLRKDLAEDNIKVTAILPGATNTASWDGQKTVLSIIEPSDIASAVLNALNMSDSANINEIIIEPLKNQ